MGRGPAAVTEGEKKTDPGKRDCGEESGDGREERDRGERQRETHRETRRRLNRPWPRSGKSVATAVLDRYTISENSDSSQFS
ncbi:hypothetical protein NDU88_006942 [Pleurodeles waltl]|uniref:Uncharacterized protein n=1 Tax=Pleurodeles waltl TaxID=8319 RepID=A0AAV7RTG7_PLEWA|nr:hypothetical protein NDU88_006942 [Pleurodeles waltl]